MSFLSGNLSVIATTCGATLNNTKERHFALSQCVTTFHKMKELKFLFDQDFGYLILERLDFKSIEQSRLVCKNWKESIESEQVWLNKQLEYILDAEKPFEKRGYVTDQGPQLPYPPKTFDIEYIIRIDARRPLFLRNFIINEAISSKFPEVAAAIKRVFYAEKTSELKSKLLQFL